MTVRLFGALLLLCCAFKAAAKQQESPNILLLMAEDMSARVGAFGDPVAITPNLDAMASQGVMYPNTFTTAGVCAPSRAAHILGIHQISSGTQHMRSGGGPNGGYKSVPPAEVKAYPELLRRAGYYTYTGYKLDYQFSGPMYGTGPFTIWDDEGFGTHWRKREPGQPFYGLVNFQVTHESGVFRPLGDWPNSMIHLAMQVMRAVRSPDVEASGEVAPGDVQLPPYYPDTPTVRADMARHYNNIAIMDAEVGALLRQLEEDGIADSTIVIWTTDHGDGLPRGKRELFDSGIKVPMIIRWPERFRPEGVRAGSVETRLVSLVDFAPTLLRLAGVEPPGYLQGRDFLQGEPRDYIYASRDRIDEVPDRQRAVGDGRYKYIRSWRPQQPGGHALEFRDNIDMVREMQAMYAAGELNAAQRQWFEPPGKERLFDTDADPYELNDLAGDPAHAVELQRMRGAMDAWLASVEDWSDMPEEKQAAAFQPGGEQRETPPPKIALEGGLVSITAVDGASVGYRLDEGPWRLYSTPVTAPAGTLLEARAVRYGWKESEGVELQLP